MLDKLASVLQSNGGVRITLTAYAAVGDSTSPREARRMSLTRALAVRDYLTSKGISSSRIDVRALGANVPSGDPDRVDVKAN
jgi:outer membrane protein OmpA-like peptidoglycan-associated protein